MATTIRSNFQLSPQYQPLMREVGLDADGVFVHPGIKVWRSLADRENCTLDTRWQGRPIRLHIKRYHADRGSVFPADLESKGIQELIAAQIPTVPLVGWGHLADGRSFVITEDLAGYEAADKLLARGLGFDVIRDATADLAARLHGSGLHHRDLYLCHFFIKENAPSDVRLIDTARVARLRNVFTRQRWIRKDLAQFWYSTMALDITNEQRQAWLNRYSQQRGMPSAAPLIKGIQRKVNWIARHDRKLRAAEPTRNISIPS